METSSLQPSLELSIPSEFGYEKIAREAVAAFARRLGFDCERIEDLKTALGEACINAIEHGNQRGSGLRVSVSCVVNESALLIDVQDQGVQRFQGCGAPATIDSKLDGAAPYRGMGLMLIRELVDEAEFVDTPNGGNRFRLMLRRARAVASAAV
ncbi:ATP-binding protein [Chloroflexia bacterium SDU3-3]|nr:ATP-binding protein [Chloroflexia bacterium SDU3-3]